MGQSQLQEQMGTWLRSCRQQSIELSGRPFAAHRKGAVEECGPEGSSRGPGALPQPFSSGLREGTCPGVSWVAWCQLNGDCVIKWKQLRVTSDSFRSEDKGFYLNLSVVFVVIRCAMLTMGSVKTLKRAKHTN